MGRHSRPDECELCHHEPHDAGVCYYCGIFADQMPRDNPCSSELGIKENTDDKVDS